jgi:2-C-methyl-D-erythritol 4-phosphate cytidylyltransferase
MVGAPGRVAALVLGAGRGERLGHALPKAFVPLAGRTLIEISIGTLAEAGVFECIVPVIAAADLDRFDALGLAGIQGLSAPVVGGDERQDSARAGLASLSEEIEYVAVHDAARCLVSVEDVRAVVSGARECGAAILAERVRDTIKRVAQGRILETPPREECWAAQTPQVSRRDWLVEAVESATRSGRQATDDAQLLEWTGRSVRVVEAGSPNPKITRLEDLMLAEAMLAKRKQG